MKRLISILLTIILCFSAMLTAFSAAADSSLGDIDMDNALSVMDATALQRHLALLDVLSDEALSRADVSGDESVSIVDATLIQQYLASLIDEFPALRTKVYGVRAAAVSDSVIRVQWNAIEGATKFWVYVNSELYASTTTANYLDVVCKTSKTYEIKVTARLKDGSMLSVDDADAVYVTMENLPDCSVSSVNITDVTHNSIALSWDSNSDFSKYWVYANDICINSTTDTSYVIEKLTPSTTYEIYVLAQLTGGTMLKKVDATLLNITTLEEPTEPPTEPPTESPIVDFDDYANRIKSEQNDHTLTISLLSDVHYDASNANDSKKLENIEKMGELQERVDVDMVANLGDFVVGNVDKQTTLSSLTKLLDFTDKACDSPVLNVRGNHDDNGWYSLEGNGGSSQKDEIINNKEWCDLAIGAAGDDFVTDGNNPYGGYGYIDHEDSKIRVFMINSCDIPYILESDSKTYRYNSYQCYAISNEQLNFVADALHFDDKDNPDDWAALFLTHVPFDTTNDNGYRFGTPDALIRGHKELLSIISAYRKGTSYSYSGSTYNASLNEVAEDFYVDIDVDYSQKGLGDVICFVSGHTHADNLSRQVGHENSHSYGYTYLSLIGSESFETIVVDREKSTVRTFKYGEVRPQSSIPTSNPGAIDGQSEQNIDMTPGVWTVYFDQFRPTGASMYNGLSDIWTNHFFDSSATLDFETLEVSKATENSSWVISKAVPVKSATQYIIPDIGNSSVQYYSYLGKYSGSLTSITDFSAGQKLLTTKNLDGYLVFVFHTKTYPRYSDFYIKEYAHGVSY